MNSDQPKLGHLIDANQKRDAIHIAVAPVVATERLSPGQDIGFIEEGNKEKVCGHAKNPIGIVDPFLTMAVFKGDRFWMFLYPYSITSLRHAWTHPAFSTRQPEEDPLQAASVKWLREFAEDIGLDYDTVIRAGKTWIEEHEGYVFDHDTPDRCWSDRLDFWRNWEVVTGMKADDQSGVPFQCAC